MLTALHQRSLNVNGASPSSPIDPNDDLVHFCHLAALVMTVYDHVITLDNEVEYIWSKSWSKSKVLYVLARYFGDILLISVCVVFLNRDASHLLSPSNFHFRLLFCHPGEIGLKFVGTGSMITIIITQMIMQSRIKALYGQIVSTLITVFWVMEVIAVLSLGIASLAAIDVHPVSLDMAKMCNPTYLPRYAFLFWVPVIVFESFLFLLALRIAYQNYREIGTWRGASLIYVILRDNFSFFICAFIAYLVTATTWLTANPRYFTVPGAFSCSLTTIMGCRLIFNLCEAYHHPRDPDATLPASIWAAATSGNVFFVNPHVGVGAGANGLGLGSGEVASQGEMASRGGGKKDVDVDGSRRSPVGWAKWMGIGEDTSGATGKGKGKGKGGRRRGPGAEDSLKFASFGTRTKGSEVLSGQWAEDAEGQGGGEVHEMREFQSVEEQEEKVKEKPFVVGDEEEDENENENGMDRPAGLDHP